ncbi:MAG TPA: rRNA maturation RNase YbeY [Rhizomicrobium sp.]|nr:rRNA maturation RNase YbeY [Rhizomicrobium sp.]
MIVEEPAWNKTGVSVARVKSAARLALVRGVDASCSPPPFRSAALARHRRGGGGQSHQLTLLLTNDERLQALNARFRGKDAPTNVLSFPAAGTDGYLGDIAIAFGVTTSESAAAGISLEDHTLHLAVHGVLHLLGYDHVRNREAHAMERLEAAILDELGIPDPYTRAAVMQ